MGAPPHQVPIVIGVTGHRDLRPQDMASLEREIGAVFTRLRRDYTGEGHGSTPLILLSALAEGADRVFARVALSMGIKLIAPLPLPVAEYRRDFEPGLDPGAAAEFDRLMSQAAATPVMPFTPGNSLEAVRSDPGKRADQYRAVGLFIVQHCDILVALWDGNERERAVGGTAEVIAFKREGIPLVVSGSAHASLDGSEIGPVVHIVTPRMKAGSPATAVAVRPWGMAVIDQHRGSRSNRWLEFLKEYFANVLGRELESAIVGLSPEDQRDLQAWETFGALIKLTREFNGEALALEADVDGPRQQASSIEHLFTDPDNGRLDADAQQRALRWLRCGADSSLSPMRWHRPDRSNSRPIGSGCSSSALRRFSSLPWPTNSTLRSATTGWPIGCCAVIPCSSGSYFYFLSGPGGTATRSDFSITARWRRRCVSPSTGTFWALRAIGPAR